MLEPSLPCRSGASKGLPATNVSEGSPHVSRLLSGAEKFAQSSLRARLDDDSMVYLLHAATSLELLAKAYLASLAGSLIAANHFDSLLHCSGLSAHAKTRSSRMKTITMTEALQRVGHVEPAFDNQRPSLQLLAEVRNGVVHAGLLEPEEEDAVLIPYLRACDFLIEHLPDADREQVWGEFLSTVDARLSESTEQTELLITDAVAAARLTFEQRYSSMEATVREAVLAGIEGSYDVTKYEQAPIDCPACGQRALTSGHYEVDWEVDWDVEGSHGEAYIVGAYPVVTYWPGYLHCRVCDLELDGEDQLKAAGVEKSWPIEDADPSDFYEEEDY